MRSVGKGQTNIEFIISISVFIVAVSYVSYMIISNVPLFVQQSSGDISRTKAYQISQLLLFDTGWPENWDGATPPIDLEVLRLGLSTGEPYILDENKLTELNNICNNDPDKIADLLDQERAGILINITTIDGAEKVYCRSTVSSLSSIYLIDRFAVLNNVNNDIVRVRVGVSR